MALRRMTQTWESMLSSLSVRLRRDVLSESPGLSESGSFSDDDVASESDILSESDVLSASSVSLKYTGRPSSGAVVSPVCLCCLLGRCDRG